MANFNIPAAQTTYETNLTDFLGVDFSSSITDIDKRRSPAGYNFINTNGTIEKRNGYKILAYLGESANINGIWNVDTIEGEYFVVHCGTKLYEMEADFSSYSVILAGLKDAISQGVIINSKLLIVDGKRAIIYDLLESGNRANWLDETGYIPTTHVARSPDGLKTQKYEKVNLIQDCQINLFHSTATDTIYQLSETAVSSIELVEVLNNEGVWVDKILTTDYTINKTKGQVIFKSTLGECPIEGDNVRIKFKKISVSNKSQINKCSLIKVYGYAGANNRVFLAGNPDYANILSYSYLENVCYIPVDNVIKIGLEVTPITGIVRLNSGKLAILKDVSDTDSTIFYIGYGMFGGEEVFPLEGSTKGEGNISQHAHDTLLNEPLILSKNGIFALNSATLNDERFVYHRSYYIDRKLREEANLENSIGIVNDGKYYLAINNHVYVADSRFKSTSQNSKYSNYQFEWYFWTGLPVRIWFVWNNELYFGDKYGNICKFRENADTDRFKDNTTVVESEWNSVILDLNNPSRKKNIKRISITSNPTNSKLVVGYRLKGGDKEVMSKIYTNSTYPKTTVIRKKAKKLSFFSIYIGNEENSNMNFNAICVDYTVGSFYKGD